MVWHTPINWNTGIVVNSGHLNEQVRDNLLSLWQRPKAVMATPNLGASTTSTAWVDIDPTATLTLTGGTSADVLLMMMANLTWANGAAWTDRAFFRFDVDGVPFGITPRITRYGNDGNYIQYSMFGVKLGLSAGNHVYKVQWLVGGTAGLQATVSHFTFLAREIG